jgi:3-oxoacyl-[acyl-carrier-protein] synthase-1
MSKAAQAPGRAEILSVGMVTPLGFCSPQTAAAARTRIARFAESYVLDQFNEPIVMGLVKDEELPPLVDPLENAKLPVQRRRLLRMAAPAIAEALADVREPVPLLLATAEARRGSAPMVDPAFLEQVATQSQCELDLKRTRLVAQGRAAGLLALEQAVGLLERREAPYVLVGGVDSYLDEGLLAALDEERRLRNGDVQDGFVPGEAAAFLLLGQPGAGARLGVTPLARILGIGIGREPGHIYSTEPYRGEGLAQAFAALLGALRQPERVRTLYAGLNGESFWAKELGVARLRNHEHFEEPVQVEHPADVIGDAGAALGPVMVGLAAEALHGGYRPGPSLVYCGSDREERAAVLLGT